MKIVSNCPLCEEKSLHVLGEDELQTQQCINCGYVTAERYRIGEGGVDENKEYNKLTDEMKSWAQVENDRIWLLTIMALPLGMLFPINIDNMVNHKTEMKWALAPMVEKPEDERKKYPNPNIPGKFYERRIDTDNAIVYETFLEGMVEVNSRLKEKEKPKPTKVKLPKLKKLK